MRKTDENFGDNMKEKKENKTKKSAFWERAFSLLQKPRRSKKGMNLSRLSSITKEGDIVLVADKLLGSGKMTHKLTIACDRFSASASILLKKAGCKVQSVAQLRKENPKGTGVMLVK